MSKSQIEWITDREPMAEDGDEQGFVLTEEGYKLRNHVVMGERWIHVPRSPRTGEEMLREENSKLRALLRRCKAELGNVDPLSYSHEERLDALYGDLLFLRDESDETPTTGETK